MLRCWTLGEGASTHLQSLEAQSTSIVRRKQVQQLQTLLCDAMFGGELVARNCLASLRVLGAGHTALSSPSSASAHTSF